MSLKAELQPLEEKPKTLTRVLLAKFGDRAFDFFQKKFLKFDAAKAEAVGERLGLIHYTIDRKHRNRTFSNLRLVFKDWSEIEIRSVGKEVFRHFGRITGDFLRTPVRSNDEVTESVVEVEGIENLEAAEKLGNGIILVTGHFGNWERFSQWYSATGRKLNVIARDANQEGVQEKVLKIRESAGANVLSRGNSARLALSCLRKNEAIGVLADQNSPEAMVPFFGMPAGNALGPAVLHNRTGAALVPSYCVWLSPCTYKVIFLPMIDPDNLEEDRIRVMQKLNESLESVIRRYPSQWLWMHDRWKLARKAGFLQE